MVRLSQVKQIQDRRPATGQTIGCAIHFFTVLDRHFQKEVRVEKCLDDGPRVAEPVLIVRHFEFVAGALGDNFGEPAVHRMVGQQVPQEFADFLGFELKAIDLE